MSHFIYNAPYYNAGAKPTQLRNPRENLLDLSDLSRFLLGADTPQELMEDATRHIVDILGVDFCKIILLESNQHFYTRAAYYRNYIVVRNQANLPESKAVEKLFIDILDAGTFFTVNASDKGLTVEERFALGLNSVSRVCILPMCVELNRIGVMVIGDGLGYTLDLQREDTRYLIDLITDQLSNAIYRSRINQQLENFSLESVLALSRTLETRDINSGNHSKGMAELSEKVAIRMKCNTKEVREICWASLLHDIGKIGIEDRILRKPGPLDDAEWERMKTHPLIGAQIVKGISGLESLAPLIESHHERLDGSGYPNHLKGDEIPLGARILAVVDSYCAMTEGRIYRPAIPHEEAIDILIKGRNTVFDPEVVNALVEVLS
jgi:putative nucleotidyltransferase with HDIG domain